MDDELLFHDWEADDEEMAEAAAQGGGSAAGVAASGSAAAAASPAELAALRAENEALRGMLEAMRAVVLADEGMRELAAEAAQQRAHGGSAGEASTSAAAAAAGGGAAAAPEDEEAKRIDESYFDSYSTFDIHREMLADKVGCRAGWTVEHGGEGQGCGCANPPAVPCSAACLCSPGACSDSYFPSAALLDLQHLPCLKPLTCPAPPQVRTEAYRDALEKNPSLMRGAKVLDVGCGTGILSMCAARGGAAAVVGIDGSEQVGRGRGRR